MEVVEGQLLATLDDATLQRRVESAQAKLISSRTDLSEARSTYERIESLYAARGASEKDRQSALSALAGAESRLKGAQSDLENAKSDLASTKLVAPFSGRVESVQVDPFEEVTAGAEIIRMQSEDVLEVKVRVPETLIRHVNYGDTVEIGFSSLEGTTLSGSVISIAAEAIEGNAFPVTVRLTATDLDIRPGMTASATFNFDKYLEGNTVYLIPVSAIAIDTGLINQDKYKRAGDGKFSVAPVFVLDPVKNILEERAVSVGHLRDNEVEIYKGLEKGELVVVAGIPFLQDQMPATRWAGSESSQDK
jgi:RND family efflux transporter MFP subunit